MLNKVMLIGYSGNDAEELQSKDGSQTFAKFRLATSSGNFTQWHSILVTNEVLAKRAMDMVFSGTRVYIEGQLSYRMVNEKQYTSVVVPAFNGQLLVLDAKGAVSENKGSQSYASPKEETTLSQAIKRHPDARSMKDLIDDDIPF